MNDNEILDALKKENEIIEVPESLRPDNIIDKLGEQIDNKQEASEDVRESNKEMAKTCKLNKKRKIKRVIVSMISAAAAIVVVLAGIKICEVQTGWGLYNKKFNSDFKTLTSYAKLEWYIEKQQEEENRDFWFSDAKGETSNDMWIEEDFVTLGPSEDKGNPSYGVVGDGNVESDSDSINDYTDTNVRTEGILEGDIVKTDGKYIYVLATDDLYNSYLTIIEAEGEQTECVTKFKLDSELEEYFENIGYERVYDILSKELMLYDDLLIFIGSMDHSVNQNSTVVVTFDISNKSNIMIKNGYAVSGRYEQCVSKDGYLYLLTNYMIDIDDDEIEPIINAKEMDCSDIYLTDAKVYDEYSIMTSYNLNNNGEKIDEKAVITDGDAELYASNEHLHILASKYTKKWLYEYEEQMQILQFAYKDGVMTAMNTTAVDGWLEDVFCIDEYNGYLRLVITSYDNDYNEINTLYVFDSKDLSITGKINDIAPGERIYSANFDGDIGYFVTFEQVDPLFSVDLSDPENPEIIGKLKIPGYSEYMYNWTDGKMLGIGEEDWVSIKLSMFDTTDPTNVIEESKYLLGDEEGYCMTDATSDHRAILLNPEKNIIGFFVNSYEEIGNYEWRDINKYVIFAYEEDDFVLKCQIDIGENYGDTRGIHIDEYVYITTGLGDIYVVSLDTYELITHINVFE